MAMSHIKNGIIVDINSRFVILQGQLKKPHEAEATRLIRAISNRLKALQGADFSKDFRRVHILILETESQMGMLGKYRVVVPDQPVNHRMRAKQ